MAQLATLLQQASQNFQQNNFSGVETICQKILATIPNQPDALHILAMAKLRLGSVKSGEQLFEQAIKVQSNNPSLYFNYANHLLSKGQFNKAVELYRKCLQLQPQNANAHYNLGLAATNAEDYNLALQHLQQAKKLQPKNLNIAIALGNAYKRNSDFDNAIDQFDQVINEQADNFQAWFNKGSTLRTKGEPDAALACYQKIKKQGAQSAEFHFNLGCAYYDLNQIDQASQSLQKAIEIHPEYVLAHETLNKLKWETAETESFNESYLKVTPTLSAPSLPLTYSFISQLLFTKQYEQAIAETNRALKTFGNVPSLTHVLATLHTYTKTPENWREKCLFWFQSCVNSEPDNTRFRIDLANQYIAVHEYKKALAHLDIAAKLEPNNQEVWAYLGICWRLTGDERGAWLNNYQTLVKKHRIVAPAHYDNLEHFLNEVKTCLNQLHLAEKSPLDQSVRMGSQTTGHLLLKPIKVIQELNLAIREQTQAYLQALPVDTTHPFLSRNHRTFKIEGSWSVNLRDQGFHTNHIHPHGWLSAPVYISIPQIMSAQDPEQQGWIKFGETSLDMGENEEVAMSLCPTAGDIVFFPSYMWHGTFPFAASQSRMTTALDIQPV
ncbi:tetratricopeptide repeat protein [Thalassotalea litorea]|nr:tetratricopeptide repeat protein [Thalassotalea litorea]